MRNVQDASYGMYVPLIVRELSLSLSLSLAAVAAYAADVHEFLLPVWQGLQDEAGICGEPGSHEWLYVACSVLCRQQWIVRSVRACVLYATASVQPPPSEINRHKSLREGGVGSNTSLVTPQSVSGIFRTVGLAFVCFVLAGFFASLPASLSTSSPA